VLERGQSVRNNCARNRVETTTRLTFNRCRRSPGCCFSRPPSSPKRSRPVPVGPRLTVRFFFWSCCANRISESPQGSFRSTCRHSARSFRFRWDTSALCLSWFFRHPVGVSRLGSFRQVAILLRIFWLGRNDHLRVPDHKRSSCLFVHVLTFLLAHWLSAAARSLPDALSVMRSATGHCYSILSKCYLSCRAFSPVYFRHGTITYFLFFLSCRFRSCLWNFSGIVCSFLACCGVRRRFCVSRP